MDESYIGQEDTTNESPKKPQVPLGVEGDGADEDSGIGSVWYDAPDPTQVLDDPDYSPPDYSMVYSAENGDVAYGPGADETADFSGSWVGAPEEHGLSGYDKSADASDAYTKSGGDYDRTSAAPPDPVAQLHQEFDAWRIENGQDPYFEPPITDQSKDDWATNPGAPEPGVAAANNPYPLAPLDRSNRDDYRLGRQDGENLGIEYGERSTTTPGAIDVIDRATGRVIRTESFDENQDGTPFDVSQQTSTYAGDQGSDTTDRRPLPGPILDPSIPVGTPVPEDTAPERRILDNTPALGPASPVPLSGPPIPRGAMSAALAGAQPGTSAPSLPSLSDVVSGVGGFFGAAMDFIDRGKAPAAAIGSVTGKIEKGQFGGDIIGPAAEAGRRVLTGESPGSVPGLDSSVSATLDLAADQLGIPKDHPLIQLDKALTAEVVRFGADLTNAIDAPVAVVGKTFDKLGVPALRILGQSREAATLADAQNAMGAILKGDIEGISRAQDVGVRPLADAVSRIVPGMDKVLERTPLGKVALETDRLSSAKQALEITGADEKALLNAARTGEWTGDLAATSVTQRKAAEQLVPYLETAVKNYDAAVVSIQDTLAAVEAKAVEAGAVNVAQQINDARNAGDWKAAALAAELFSPTPGGTNKKRAIQTLVDKAEALDTPAINRALADAVGNIRIDHGLGTDNALAKGMKELNAFYKQGWLFGSVPTQVTNLTDGIGKWLLEVEGGMNFRKLDDILDGYGFRKSELLLEAGTRTQESAGRGWNRIPWVRNYISPVYSKVERPLNEAIAKDRVITIAESLREPFAKSVPDLVRSEGFDPETPLGKLAVETLQARIRSGAPFRATDLIADMKEASAKGIKPVHIPPPGEINDVIQGVAESVRAAPEKAAEIIQAAKAGVVEATKENIEQATKGVARSKAGVATRTRTASIHDRLIAAAKNVDGDEAAAAARDLLRGAYQDIIQARRDYYPEIDRLVALKDEAARAGRKDAAAKYAAREAAARAEIKGYERAIVDEAVSTLTALPKVTDVNAGNGFRAAEGAQRALRQTLQRISDANASLAGDLKGIGRTSNNPAYQSRMTRWEQEIDAVLTAQADRMPVAASGGRGSGTPNVTPRYKEGAVGRFASPLDEALFVASSPTAKTAKARLTELAAQLGKSEAEIKAMGTQVRAAFKAAGAKVTQGTKAKPTQFTVPQVFGGEGRGIRPAPNSPAAARRPSINAGVPEALAAHAAEAEAHGKHIESKITKASADIIAQLDQMAANAAAAPDTALLNEALAQSKTFNRIGEKAASIWANVGDYAVAKAYREQSRVYNDYISGRTRLHAVLDWIVPFSLWQTMNPIYYGEVMLRNPWLGVQAAKYMRDTEQERQRRGLGPSFIGAKSIGKPGVSILGKPTADMGIAGKGLQYVFGDDERFVKPSAVLSILDQGIGVAQSWANYQRVESGVAKGFNDDADLNNAKVALGASLIGGVNVYPYISVPLGASGVFGTAELDRIAPAFPLQPFVRVADVAVQRYLGLPGADPYTILKVDRFLTKIQYDNLKKPLPYRGDKWEEIAVATPIRDAFIRGDYGPIESNGAKARMYAAFLAMRNGEGDGLPVNNPDLKAAVALADEGRWKAQIRGAWVPGRFTPGLSDAANTIAQNKVVNPAEGRMYGPTLPDFQVKKLTGGTTKLPDSVERPLAISQASSAPYITNPAELALRLQESLRDDETGKITGANDDTMAKAYTNWKKKNPEGTIKEFSATKEAQDAYRVSAQGTAAAAAGATPVSPATGAPAASSGSPASPSGPGGKSPDNKKGDDDYDTATLQPAQVTAARQHAVQELQDTFYGGDKYQKVRDFSDNFNKVNADALAKLSSKERATAYVKTLEKNPQIKALSDQQKKEKEALLNEKGADGKPTLRATALRLYEDFAGKDREVKHINEPQDESAVGERFVKYLVQNVEGGEQLLNALAGVRGYGEGGERVYRVRGAAAPGSAGTGKTAPTAPSSLTPDEQVSLAGGWNQNAAPTAGAKTPDSDTISVTFPDGYDGSKGTGSGGRGGTGRLGSGSGGSSGGSTTLTLPDGSTARVSTASTIAEGTMATDGKSLFVNNNGKWVPVQSHQGAQALTQLVRDGWRPQDAQVPAGFKIVSSDGKGNFTFGKTNPDGSLADTFQITATAGASSSSSGRSGTTTGSSGLNLGPSGISTGTLNAPIISKEARDAFNGLDESARQDIIGSVRSAVAKSLGRQPMPGDRDDLSDATRAAIAGMDSGVLAEIISGIKYSAEVAFGDKNHDGKPDGAARSSGSSSTSRAPSAPRGGGGGGRGAPPPRTTLTPPIVERPSPDEMDKAQRVLGSIPQGARDAISRYGAAGLPPLYRQSLMDIWKNSGSGLPFLDWLKLIGELLGTTAPTQEPESFSTLLKDIA